MSHSQCTNNVPISLLMSVSHFAFVEMELQKIVRLTHVNTKTKEKELKQQSVGIKVT